MTNTKKGFTLIELLIVITIIGILAAALLPNILAAPTRARDAARQADVNSIVSGIEAMNADGTSYPTTAQCVSTIAGLETYVGGGVIPSDPQGATGTAWMVDGATDCDGSYFYCPVTASANQNYAIVARLEDASGGNHDLSGDICANGTSDLAGSGQYHVVIQ